MEIGEKKRLMSGRRQEWNRRKFIMEELKVSPLGKILDNAPVIRDLLESYQSCAVSRYL